MCHIDPIIPTMMFIHQIILKILSKITRPRNIGHVDSHLLWKQSHWTMKYRSHRPTFILRSNVRLYWPLIPKYYVHTSNSLQEITQNLWAIKYRSQWPIFILRYNFGSYWLIIPNNNVHASNSLQGIRQNYWTMEYRSQWPTLIFRSNVWSYWFILPKYDVHTSNSLPRYKAKSLDHEI